ncbi:MAG: hypothetical protein LBT27_02895 [Prevotellaceae bacterium]|jgi:hypothetical protein|nr:hypothetical protein [Prevotellaceae bacterium]
MQNFENPTTENHLYIYRIATAHKYEVKLQKHSNHITGKSSNFLKKRARPAKPVRTGTKN